MKKIIFSALALLTLASCTKESVETTDIWNGELRITSGIETRAIDQTWDSGDVIGVYMTETGSTSDYIGKANTPYSTTSTSTEADFSVVSTTDAPFEQLYYPQSGNIDIMAYYPYDGDNTVGAYAIDVTTQTPSKAIDLMIATATDVEKSKNAIPLTFEHKLSKMVVTLTPAENSGLTIDDLKNMTVVLSGTKAKARYDLNATESPINFGTNVASTITLPTAVVGSTSAVITSIVIPQSATPTFTFTLGGTDKYSVTASSMEFVEGSEHNYSIEITKTAAIIKGSKINAWGDGTDENGLTADDLE